MLRCDVAGWTWVSYYGIDSRTAGTPVGQARTSITADEGSALLVPVEPTQVSAIPMSRFPGIPPEG